MTVFVSNFTDANINEDRIRTIASRYLAKRKTVRIIRVGVIFLSRSRMQKLNKYYRDKDYIPDVLTFTAPLNEILICPEQAAQNGHAVEYLVEHGLNHLLGKHH